MQKIIAAGFKPLAITTMICEETFVFQTKKEYEEVLKHFENSKYKNEGWWYAIEDDKYFWDETIKWYRETTYKDDPENAPKVYWLNGKVE